MRRIGGIFGRSAYGPLYEHALKVQDCLQLVVPLMRAFISVNYEEIGRLAQQVHERESSADRIKNEIRRKLSHSFLHSVERSEILLTLKAQDDVSDSCEDVAQLLEIRRTHVPERLAGVALELAEQAVEAGFALVEIDHRLPGLEEASFPEEGIRQLNDQLNSLHLKEYEANLIEQKALREVIAAESQLDPVSVMFLVQIVQQLGAIADAAENAADCIERMIGRR